MQKCKNANFVRFYQSHICYALVDLDDGRKTRVSLKYFSPSRKKAGIHTDASLLSFFLSAVVILAFLSRFCSHRDSRGR